MNNVISLLGVQGLSRNNYSVVQLKVVLAIIGHAQKVIKNYVVDGQMPNKSMRKRLTARQMADGYVVVVIRLSDLCAHTSRYSQVKNAIVDMAKRKPIAIPYKCDVNQMTYYAEFPRLFSCEFIRMGGHLAVEFRFSNDLLDYFYSFDKGGSPCASGCGESLLQCIIHQALHHHPLLVVEGIYQDRSQEVCGADARQGELLQILQRSDVEEPPAGTRRPEATLRLWHGRSVSHAIYLLFRGGCPES